MARTKQTPRKDDVEKEKKVREPIEVGGQQLKSHFIDPLYPHQEIIQGIHHTKV